MVFLRAYVSDSDINVEALEDNYENIFNSPTEDILHHGVAEMEVSENIFHSINTKSNNFQNDPKVNEVLEFLSSLGQIFFQTIHSLKINVEVHGTSHFILKLTFTLPFTLPFTFTQDRTSFTFIIPVPLLTPLHLLKSPTIDFNR